MTTTFDFIFSRKVEKKNIRSHINDEKFDRFKSQLWINLRTTQNQMKIIEIVIVIVFVLFVILLNIRRMYKVDGIHTLMP